MITQTLLRALDRKAIWLIVILVLVAIAVPIGNLAFPPDSPFHVQSYVVSLVGKYLAFAMLALALDLVWGYCGILSLGHGAFFALGAYGMGMYLMRQIGSRGVYANPILPDFMVFLNYSELPWFWQGFDNFAFALLMIVLVPGLLAFIFGWFAFRSRVSGVYLSIVTQAMTFALLMFFRNNDMGFGGTNGFTDFKDILGQSIQADQTRSALFAATSIALALSILVCSAIVNSKLGKVMVAIRDAESRTRFIGYRVENVKAFAFTASAVMAAIAGALYVPQVGIINPGEFDPGKSIEAVIWVAVGGRGTLVGPIVGAVLVNLTKTVFTSGGGYMAATAIVLLFAALVAMSGGWKRGLIVLAAPLAVVVYGIVAMVIASGVPEGGLPAMMQALPRYMPNLSEIWPFALGGLFILVTLFLPGGVVGTINDLFRHRRRPTGKRASAAAEAGQDPRTLTPAAPEPAE